MRTSFAGLLALSLFSAAALAAESTATKLNLEDSIALAVKASTTVLKAQRDSELGGTQVLQSYLQFLPNLTAQGAYNYAKGKTYLTTAAPTLVDASNYGANYTVSTTLNIFNGFADVAAWSASQERRAVADKSLRRAQQYIALDISQSFLQAVLNQKLVGIAEKNLKASKDRQTLLEEQTKVGIRNKSDLFRQQAQTSADESFLITVQNNSQTNLITLLKKLRLSPDGKYELTEPPLEDQVAKLQQSVNNIHEEDSIRQALDHRPDYEVSRRTAEAARKDVTTLRSAYWPKLDFVASYLSSSRNLDTQLVNNINVVPASQLSLDQQLRDQGSYVYGLVLTWNIFDRWSSSLNVERGKAVAYKSELDAEDYRNQVVGEVKQALNDYRAAVAQLDTSQRGLVAARKAYEVSEGRYEVGSLSYVDLAAAQTQLVQAEANRAQALIGFELQKRAVDFALGN
jgi:outer membrane protein